MLGWFGLKWISCVCWATAIINPGVAFLSSDPESWDWLKAPTGQLEEEDMGTLNRAEAGASSHGGTDMAPSSPWAAVPNSTGSAASMLCPSYCRYEVSKSWIAYSSPPQPWPTHQRPSQPPTARLAGGEDQLSQSTFCIASPSHTAWHVAGAEQMFVQEMTDRLAPLRWKSRMVGSTDWCPTVRVWIPTLHWTNSVLVMLLNLSFSVFSPVKCVYIINMRHSWVHSIRVLRRVSNT